MLVSYLSTVAQTDAIIGAGSNSGTTANGAGTDGGPMYNTGASSTFFYSKHHMVFTAAELAAAGLTPNTLIQKLAFRKANNAAVSSASPILFDIHLKNSAATAVLPAPQDYVNLISGATLVYSSTNQAFLPDTGWIDFNLITPFLYTGGAIELTTAWDMSAAGTNSSTANFAWYKDPANIISHTAATQSGTLNNARTVRAQTRFTFIPASPCIDPPTPGNAISSAANVCAGQNFSLSLQGTSFGTGQTYQWQTSADSVNWVNVTGATNANLTTTQATSLAYYRCNVTCGATTLPSAGVRVEALVTGLAGNYTINPALPVSSTNFHTLGSILTHINCAGITGQTTILVSPGTYTGTYQLGNFSGSQFGLNISSATFNATDVIFTNGGSGDVFVLNGANNVSFNNISVEITSIGACFSLTDASNVSIAGCNIKGFVGSTLSTNRTIYATRSTNLTISGNNISHSYYGVFLTGATAPNYDTGNNVLANTFTDIYYYGMYFLGQHGINIIGNHLSNFQANASGYGVRIERMREMNFSDNQMYGYMGAYGLYGSNLNLSPAGVNNKIYNNVFSNDYASATPRVMYFLGSSTDTTDGIEIYHNSISARFNSASTTSTGLIFFTGGSATTPLWITVIMRNNSISLNKTGTTATTGVVYFVGTYVSDIFQASHNNYYYDGQGTSPIVRVSTTNYNTLADWQLLGKDTLSISANPLYNSITDLNCLGTSPNRNAGTTISGITTDINGQARDLTPDIGAYEIQLAANDLVVSAILSPGSSVMANTSYPVSMQVVNVGTATVTSFSASYQLGSGAVVTQTFSGSIPSQDTITFTFTQNLTTPTSGSPILSMWTANPNGSADANPNNDTLSILMCLAIPGGTYTVGNPTADFPTLEILAEVLSCGGILGPVTFNLDAPNNSISGNLHLGQIPGSSVINTVTFNGQSDTIVAAFKSSNIGGITLDGSAHVKITNTVIRINGTTGAGILMNNADSNHIHKNLILLDLSATSASLGGIVSSGNLGNVTTAGSANYNLIDSNEVVGSYYGIRLNGAAGPIGNKGNIIRHNLVRENYAYNIYILQGEDVLVEGNEITRAIRTNGTTFYGIYLGTGTIGTRVNANSIHNTHDSFTSKTGAVYVFYSTAADAPTIKPNIWSNNLAYNLNIGGSGSIYGFYNSSSDGNYYYHNTLVAEDTTATGGLVYGLYQITAASDIDIKNNIFSINRTGTAAKYPLYMATATTTFSSNNNVLSNRSTTGTNGTAFFSSAFVTLADWQASNANAYDQASVNSDPAFVAAASGNLEPSALTMNNIGANLLSVVPTDYYGTNRTTTPDPGAIEYTVAGCPGPYSLAIDSVSAYIARVTWLSLATNWNIEYGPAGFTLGTGTRIYNVSNPYTLTGLLPNTSYDVYFQDSCSSTTLSAFSGPLSLTTLRDFDLSMLSIVNPDVRACQDTATQVRVVVTNKGVLPVTNYTANFSTSGLLTANLSQTRTATLAPNATDTISMGTLNIPGGGTLNMTAFVSSTADVFRDNDTLLANSVFTAVPVPVIIASADTICQGGSVTLSIDTTIGSPVWMNAAGQPFATGSHSITVNPTQTTTYTAKGAGSQHFNVGPPDTTFGSAAVFGAASLSVQSMQVTALQDVRFTRAKVYPQNTGWVVVMLRTPAGVEVDRDSAFVTVTNAHDPVYINIDLEIPAGSWYLNCFTNQSAGGMLRNSTGSAYPYTVPGIFSITGSTFGAAYYYYFYDMQLTIGGCETTTATKTIAVSPVPTGSFTAVNSGGTSYDFNASATVNANSYSWRFGDGNTGTGITASHTYTFNGTFDVDLITTNNCGNDTTTQQVTISGVGIAPNAAVAKLKVYPNPSQGELFVSFEQENADAIDLQIQDVRGRVVYRKQIQAASLNHLENIQLDYLAKGVYNLTLTSPKGRSIEKLIIH